MTKVEQIIWQTALSHPAGGAPEIAVEPGIKEGKVAKVLAKAGSAEPESIRLLKRGIELTGGDRNESYGPPYDNLTSCAVMWKAYLIAKYGGTIIDEIDFGFVAEDVAHMMTLVKMTRSFHGEYHADNYLDGAVYQAIAGECRIEEERE